MQYHSLDSHRITLSIRPKQARIALYPLLAAKEHKRAARLSCVSRDATRRHPDNADPSILWAKLAARPRRLTITGKVARSLIPGL